MPKKGKKKGGGKGKGKKGGKKAAAKAAAAAEADEMLKVCKKFVKSYQLQCASAGSVASQRILRDARACVENERPLPKFILDVQERSRRKAPGSTTRKKKVTALAASNEPEDGKLPPKPAEESSSSGATASAETTGADGPQLEPLVNTLRELNYRSLRCLHVWNLPQADEAVVALSLFLESPLGLNLRVLEMRDCRLSVWAVGRLARALRNSQLALLNLDYNRCVRLAVADLCRGLQTCSTLHSLSLNYCHLDSSSADPLGSLTASSQIKHLSLGGNSLHCEGASELVTALVSVCEGVEEQVKPPLSRLHLQDNGIDVLGEKGMVETVLFTRLLKRWLLSSEVIQEVDLGGNWIGDAGGRELLAALNERKEARLPAVRLTVTHRMSSDIFASIVELGRAGKKKGGKKRGKRKKK